MIPNVKNVLTIVAMGVLGCALSLESGATLIFSDDFNSGTAGTDPAGWTRVDILTAGDHGSIGLRPNGDASGGGGAGVFTMDGLDFFLNGGRSADFTIQVATMVQGIEYELRVFETQAGSSFDVSRIYFSDQMQTSGGTVTPLTGTVVATNAGGYNDWRSYRTTYTATASDDGNPLFINLESFRDVSTAVSGWDNIQVFAVPEPGSLALWMFGLGVLMFVRRAGAR